MGTLGGGEHVYSVHELATSPLAYDNLHYQRGEQRRLSRDPRYHHLRIATDSGGRGARGWTVARSANNLLTPCTRVILFTRVDVGARACILLMNQLYGARRLVVSLVPCFSCIGTCWVPEKACVNLRFLIIFIENDEPKSPRRKHFKCQN